MLNLVNISLFFDSLVNELNTNRERNTIAVEAFDLCIAKKLIPSCPRKVISEGFNFKVQVLLEPLENN